MQLVSTKATSPIGFFDRRSSFSRRSSLRPSATLRLSAKLRLSATPHLSAAWIICSLIAIAHLAGCGVTYNTLPLTVSPGSLSFGSVPVGQTQASTVTVQNQGLSAVTLTGMQVADPAFTLAPAATPVTIPAGGTANMTVTFTPTSVKNYNSQIVLASGGGDTKVAVSGAGESTSRRRRALPHCSSAPRRCSLAACRSAEMRNRA